MAWNETEDQKNTRLHAVSIGRASRAHNVNDSLPRKLADRYPFMMKMEKDGDGMNVAIDNSRIP